MEDQHKRGQAQKFLESEARRRYPELVVASLGDSERVSPLEL